MGEPLPDLLVQRRDRLSVDHEPAIQHGLSHEDEFAPADPKPQAGGGDQVGAFLERCLRCHLQEEMIRTAPIAVEPEHGYTTAVVIRHAGDSSTGSRPYLLDEGPGCQAAADV